MNTLLDFGPMLVAARRARGLTQHELGERVGASQQQVARWEARDYAHVDLERVSRVAAALDVMPGAPASDLAVAAEPLATYGSNAMAMQRAPSMLEFSPARLREVCSRRAVRSLALFGSVLTDDFGPQSDIDVLVEFDHDTFESKQVFRLPGELSEVFGGREIDLVEAEYVSPRLRERIMAEAWYVFTA